MQHRSILLGFLFLVLFFSNGYCQLRVVDLLEQRLDTLPESLEKIDVLLGLARAYGYCGFTEKNQEALKEVDRLSKKLNYRKGEGIVLIFRSMTEFNVGEIDQSIETAKEAINIAEEIESKDFKMMSDYNLAETYLYGKNDYTTSIHILEQALRNPDESVTKKNLANAHRALAVSYEYKGDTTKALLIFEKARDILLTYEDEPDIDPDLRRESAQLTDRGAMNLTQIEVFIGIIYRDIGQLDKALGYFLRALEVYTYWKVPYFEAATASDIAQILALQGKLEEALRYFRKAKDQFANIGNQYNEALTNLHTASIYMQLGDLSEAKDLTQEALEYFQSSHDSLYLIDTYRQLGNIELTLNNIIASEIFFSKSLDIAKILNDSLSIANVAENLGSVMTKKGQFELGLNYQKTALKIKKAFNDIVHISSALIDISNTYAEWDRPDSAIHYGLLALDYAKQTKVTTDIKNSHLALSRNYESVGNFEMALTHHKTFFENFQNLFTENAQQLAKEEQVRQNVEQYQKEKAAAVANAELLTQRNRLFMALGTTFLLLFLISGYLGFRLHWSKKEIENQNLKLTELNQTKDKFFSIIAHDIRSPMIALQSVGKQMAFYLKKERFDKLANLATMVGQTTRQLDTLLDNLLNWALLQRGLILYRPKLMSLKDVVSEVSELFAGAMEAKNIQFEKCIPDETQVMADELALTTTLRNLMSNAVKFTKPGGTISIGSVSQYGSLLVKVVDSGIGMGNDALEKLFTLEKETSTGTVGEKGTGLGLILCKELVELNKGEITVTSELGKGSSIVFSIPKG